MATSIAFVSRFHLNEVVRKEKEQPSKVCDLLMLSALPRARRPAMPMSGVSGGDGAAAAAAPAAVVLKGGE